MSLLKKKDVRYPLDPDERKTYHSRSYHNYFEDFEECEVLDEYGKSKIQRTYIGVWYTLDLSRAKNVLLLLGYSLLFLAAVFCFFYACSRSIPSNTQWLIILFEVVSLICLVWMVVSIFNYLTRPKKMTVYYFKSTSKSLLRSSRVSAVGLCATWVVSSVYAVAVGFASTALLLFPLLIAAVCCFAVFLLERRMKYNKSSAREKPLQPTDDSE